MRTSLALTLGIALLLFSGVASSAEKPLPPVQAANRGLAAAVTAGRIAPADAARYRGVLARTAFALPRLGGARKANLRAVLDDVANRAGQFTAPRALTLFSMLDVNTRYFGSKGPPPSKTDVRGPDMILYRYFPGHGFQFHPLGNFGALNAHLAAGQLDEARQLTAALAARAVDRGDGSTVWEYEFRFNGGKPPWTSGMAQAVGAQALARASQKLEEPSLLELARRAQAAIPGKLIRQFPAGPWVKLYSFTPMAVLNAQLQTAVAMRDYAAIADDSGAASLADAMTKAARTMLPRLDTGYWTLYSIGGAEENLGYHDYVIFLLGRLKTQTKDTFWSDASTRFKAYATQPPLFSTGPPAKIAAPAQKAKPKARASLSFSFWLSKSSSVVVRVGSTQQSMALGHGWHTLTWSLPRSQPGIFPVTVQARPVGGPSATTTLLPLVVLGKAQS
jgi:hypothetical protein